MSDISPTSVETESARSERTKVAPCQRACPAGIDVPRYIRHIRNRDFDGALAVIREKIPFPGVCGYACFHPCEASCARMQYDEPVAIRMLKRAAEEKGQGGLVRPKKMGSTGKRVAIIGSGPCGLTAAYYLALSGHHVTVFEKLAKAGGMLRYGIPEYRLPKQVVDREIERIKDCAVQIRTEEPVSSAKDLLGKGFDAVLVSSGAWKSIKMGIEGEDAPNVRDGLSFLKQINANEACYVGQKVVVVGGGNTAVDAARASVRLGAETVLLYRRSLENMPASAEEVAEAGDEDVHFKFMAMPFKILRNEMLCLEMVPGPLDASGRATSVPVEGSEFSLPCDTVVIAIGQKVDAKALALKENSHGMIQVDDALSTPISGIFAAGDAVLGPTSIIDAISQGRQASISIDLFLGGKGEIERENQLNDSCNIPKAKPFGTIRRQSDKVSVETRIKGFDLVEMGYDEDAAVIEAERCLSCDFHPYIVEVNPDLCKDCGYCRQMCGMGVFDVSDRFNPSGYKPAVVKNSELCAGCLKCVYICPDLAIEVREG